MVVKARLPTKTSCFWFVADDADVAVGGGGRVLVGGGKLGGGMLVFGAHMVDVVVYLYLTS